MSKKKDPNYTIKVEKAISEKYGEDTIQNPKANWNEEKEREYLDQLKKLSKKDVEKEVKTKKIDVGGFFINKNLIKGKRIFKYNCLVCEKFSFKKQDDLYLEKYDCCYKCYIQYVEDREERWKNGWRPKKELANGDNIRNN